MSKDDFDQHFHATYFRYFRRKVLADWAGYRLIIFLVHTCLFHGFSFWCHFLTLSDLGLVLVWLPESRA